MVANVPKDDTDMVSPDNACPNCGERNIDSLVWVDDQWVKCIGCGIEYDPLTGNRRAHEES